MGSSVYERLDGIYCILAVVFVRPLLLLFLRGELPKYETEKLHGCKFGARTALRDINWAGML